MQKYILFCATFTLFFVLKIAAQEVVLDSKSLLIKQNPAFKVYLEGDGRFLAMDTYRMGIIKRHRFFVGDDLTFKVRGYRGKIKEKITAITDTSFSFSEFNQITNEFDHTDVPIRNVKKIRLSRRIPWITQGIVSFPVAGLLFSMTDILSFREGQFRDPKALLIGAGLASLGVVSWKLSYPAYRLGKRHRLKVFGVH